jgi:hypothetical protein
MKLILESLNKLLMPFMSIEKWQELAFSECEYGKNWIVCKRLQRALNMVEAKIG